MKIKKGDSVIVIAGKDNGKTGKVVKAFPKENLVIVEGINKIKKHQRPTKSGAKGQVIEKSMPMNVSNVMIVEGGKGVRIGKKEIGGKNVRISRKSDKEI
ncbi:MAG: 50S ribosomal protein L24 [Candidatus Paceibacterota bacterium]|jgi:large subunit ribosomal protein L24